MSSSLQHDIAYAMIEAVIVAAAQVYLCVCVRACVRECLVDSISTLCVYPYVCVFVV